MANTLTLKIMSNIVEKCGERPVTRAGSYSESVSDRGAHYLSEAIAKTGKRVETEHESAIRAIIRGEATASGKSSPGYGERAVPAVQQGTGGAKGGTVRLDDLIKQKNLGR